MSKDKRKEVKVDDEMRNEEIAEMIDEGGLGAEKYYDIEKPDPSSEKDDKRKEVDIKHEMRTKDISKMIDEGGLGAEKYYDIKKPDPSSEDKNEDESKD